MDYKKLTLTGVLIVGMGGLWLEFKSANLRLHDTSTAHTAQLISVLEANHDTLQKLDRALRALEFEVRHNQQLCLQRCDNK